MKSRVDYIWKDLNLTGYEEIEMSLVILTDTSGDSTTPNGPPEILSYEIHESDRGLLDAKEASRLYDLFNSDEVDLNEL